MNSTLEATWGFLKGMASLELTSGVVILVTLGKMSNTFLIVSSGAGDENRSGDEDRPGEEGRQSPGDEDISGGFSFSGMMEATGSIPKAPFHFSSLWNILETREIFQLVGSGKLESAI